MNIEDQLAQLGMELPQVTVPGGSYRSVIIRRNQVFIAIQFPVYNGEFKFRGKLGIEFSTEGGIKAIQLCTLNLLAQINKHIDLDALEGLNHMDIYYRAAEGWDEAPKVADEASDLLNQVLGEKGLHTRSLLGVHHLPHHFCVGLSGSLSLKNH